MGDYADRTWYQVLEQKFYENGYELTDIGYGKRLEPLKAAQLILKKPIKRSFDEIDKIESR